MNATEDLALFLGVPEHTPVSAVDRTLTTSETAGSAARRMLHRLYLPMATAV